MNTVDAISLTGATTIVTNMVNDTWNALRDRFVQLLGRKNADMEREYRLAMDDANEAIHAAPADLKSAAVEAQRERIRAVLTEVMIKDPTLIEELRRLLTDVQHGHLLLHGGDQRAHAEGDAQQAVQYYGTQSNTFRHDARP